jgi:hypothetical protein
MFPTKYESTSIIKVNTQKWKEILSPEASGDSSLNLTFLKSEFLSKDNVARTLAEINEKYKKLITHSQFTKFMEQHGFKRKLSSVDTLIQSTQLEVKVDPVETINPSDIPDRYTVRYINSDPEVTTELPADIIRFYSESKKKSMVEYYDKIIASLRGQMTALEDKIHSTEMELNQFVQSNTSVPYLKTDIASGISDAKKSLDDVRLLIIELESRKNSIMNLLAQEPQTIESVSTVPGISKPKTTDQILLEDTAKLVQLQGKFTDEYPEIVRLKKEIDYYSHLPPSDDKTPKVKGTSMPNPEYKRLKFELVFINASLDKARAQQSELEKAIQLTQSKSGQATLVSSSIKERSTLLDRLNLLKVNFETRLTNAQIRKNFVDSNLMPLIEVVESSTLHKSPSNPRHVLILGCVLLGIGFGLFTALLRSFGILTRIQSMYGPIRDIPSFSQVSIIDTKVDEGTGKCDKVYLLTADPVKEKGLVIYTGNENEIVDTRTNLVRSRFSEDAFAIKLTDELETSFKKWWYWPIVISGYAGVGAIIVLEYFQQFYYITH